MAESRAWSVKVPRRCKPTSLKDKWWNSAGAETFQLVLFLKPRSVCTTSVNCHKKGRWAVALAQVACFSEWGGLGGHFSGWGCGVVLARTVLIVGANNLRSFEIVEANSFTWVATLDNKTLFPPHLDTQKTIFGFWKMSSKSWFVGRFKEMIISSKWWDGRGWQLIDRGLDKFPACLVQVLDKWARQLD